MSQSWASTIERGSLEFPNLRRLYYALRHWGRMSWDRSRPAPAARLIVP